MSKCKKYLEEVLLTRINTSVLFIDSYMTKENFDNIVSGKLIKQFSRFSGNQN